MTLSRLMELPGGAIGAHVRTPAAPTRAAVLVLQEIFGVNANMRRITDRFAAQGYHAVAPDLFWRLQPGVDLDPDAPASRTRAMALNEAYGHDADRGLEDLKAIVQWLKADHDKVGVVGYCLGGRLSLLSWLHAGVDAAVVYYGVGMAPHLASASLPGTPLLMHLGATDPMNPPETQQAIAERLKAAPAATLRIHEGVGHAFARLGATSYVAEAAQAADRETSAFLQRHLG